MTKTLQTDPEIMMVLPALTEDEYQALRHSIISYGRALEPITVWDGVIIDGHARYRICCEENLLYETRAIDFESKEDAKRWILETQLVQRHMTKYERVIRTERYRDIFRKQAAERQGWRKGQKQNTVEKQEANLTAEKREGAREEPQFHLMKEPVLKDNNANRHSKETVDRLAKIAGVSATLYRHALDIEGSGNKTLIEAVRSGEISITRAWEMCRAETLNIGSELDKRRGIILNAINQIAEQYEWFLSQDYERDSEIVSDIYRDAIKRCLCDNRKLYENMEDFGIVSSTGIISVNCESNAA